MRPVTMGQVRELLSSPAASAFFEAWSQMEGERLDAQQELDDLTSQIFAAEARVNAAEQMARDAASAAEMLQARWDRQQSSDEFRPILEREIEAIARAQKAKAARAMDEAGERRRRSVQLAEEADRVRLRLKRGKAARDRLRNEAAEWGGFVGEACLFFIDAEHPGGAFLVPLEPLNIIEAELPAFVLHRLPPRIPLSEAVAIRDAIPHVAEPIASQPPGADADPLTPVSESPAKARKRQRKERS